MNDLPRDQLLSSLFHRLPPANAEAEQKLLGLVLSMPDVMAKIGFLSPCHFNDPLHGRIFAEARRRIESGEASDAVGLKCWFEADPCAAAAGGFGYLAKLVGTMVGRMSAAPYARVIVDAWMRRQLIAVSDDLRDTAFGQNGVETAAGAAHASLRSLLEEVDAQGRAARFAVLTPADITDHDMRPYVVKGLISEGDHVVVMGQPGTGKSVLAPHLAYAVALGTPVFGFRTKPSTVLYISAEDPHGMKARVRALMKRHGDAPGFRLLPLAVDLTDPTDVAGVSDVVSRIKPALIIIDTIARAFPGLRENDPEAMAAVVSSVRSLSAICNSAVITVHHVAKDGGTTPRGHGCLNGDADTTILIEGTGICARSVTLGKNRSGPSDLAFGFEIEVEELGIDADGDPITAPVVVEAAPKADAFPSRRLNDRDAVMLREARDLIQHCGQMVAPEAGMPIVACVTRQLLRSRLIDRGWFAESALTGEPGKLTRAGYAPETKSLTSLKRKGLLWSNRELIWLP